MYNPILKFINFKIVSALFSWTIKTREKRLAFRDWCRTIEEKKLAPKIQKNYLYVLNKLKKQNQQIKVLFLVNENSKWKAQSLYELMEKDKKFEPIIGLTLADFQWKKTKEEQAEILKNNETFFKNRGMKTVYTYNVTEQKPIDLKKLKIDLVFYQQPWKIHKTQSPATVSKFALTFYIPYYVNNYCILPIDYAAKDFHRFLFRHYVLNKDWELLYKELSGRENFVGAGHTMLDYFYLNSNTSQENNVIYAPHWSFYHEKNDNFETIGTFLNNGKKILEFAQNHPEISWVFKPHPTLKNTLSKIGWSSQEINDYYTAWEKIGIACYDSSYIELFLNSKALITDCGSFLVEYFCTKKPIIHLISEKAKPQTIPLSEKIFNTFYKVHNLDEMYKTFEEVILNNTDNKKEQRLQVLEETKLLNNYAAKNIIDDLSNLFS